LSSFDRSVECKIGGVKTICTVKNGRLSLPVGTDFKADGSFIEVVLDGI